jgi:hypothetical protein
MTVLGAIVPPCGLDGRIEGAMIAQASASFGYAYASIDGEGEVMADVCVNAMNERATWYD